MVSFSPKTSIIPLFLLLAVPSVQADEWFVLGVNTAWECNESGGCTYTYSVGAEDMATGRLDTDKATGVGRSTQDLCGAHLFGAEVQCKGDILTDCSGYGVVWYNWRTCRTFCKATGDYSPVFNYNTGLAGESQGNDLICDKML